MAEKKETPPPQESKWRRKVESSIDFDPETAYPPMMVLDLSNGPAEWQYFTAEELKQMAKGSGASLQERFGRKLGEESLRFDSGQKFVSDRQEGYCEHKVTTICEEMFHFYFTNSISL